MKEEMDRIKTFVLDMDGTIYLGNKLFGYTKQFLKSVEKEHKKYYFLPIIHLRIKKLIYGNWNAWELRSSLNK